ncbi:MAG: hypothetical protein KA004_03395 [Verrucomicrobiales bacterium]|nr:hypothetical protein [Verrucomicrobiales bacterium]
MKSTPLLRFQAAFLSALALSACLFLPLVAPLCAADDEVPQIEGGWWSVAGNPDLGEFTSERQQPVDFAVWQAADGSWQLWSCVRETKCGGRTRLFHRWEGGQLTDTDWKPMGIAMRADPALGETDGGLQAPHVFKEQGRYHMVYGDWQRICLATSTDGKTFTRVLNARGQPDLFSGPYENTRDPMMLKVGDLFHCYYMGHKQGAPFQSAIFCRTSEDLVRWSEPVMVSAGGQAARQSNWFGGDAECPFVVNRDGRFTLFRTQLYGLKSLNTQYTSPNPLNFGVGHDDYRTGTLPVAAPEIIRHEGQWFVAALKPGLDGIRIARLRWVRKSGE